MTREDLTAYLEPNMRIIVRCLATYSDPNADAIATAERIGESRALQGVPVDAVMQSWATAERVVLDHLLAHAEPLPTAELRAAVRRLGDVITRLTSHSVDAYRRTQEEVTAHYDRLTTDLVARLTGEQPADPEEIRRRARTIGVDPSTTYLAVAIAVDGATGSAGAEAYLRAQRHLLASIAARISGRVLIGSVDEYPLMLIPVPAGADSLEAALPAALGGPRQPGPILIGLGEHVAELAAAGLACQQARDALEVGRRLGLRNRVVRFRDVVVEILLIRNPDVAAVVRRRIQPLLDRPELLETLRVFLAAGLSARETSRRLYVHPNTVPYRLRTIERLLKRPISDLTTLADLILALRLLDLHGWPG